MSLLAQDKISPEEFLSLPNAQAFELVDGELVEKNVSALSAKVELYISRVLTNYIVEHGGAEIFSPTLAYRCFAAEPTRIRRPDLTVIRRDRLERLHDPNPGLMPIIPDLAVEVISTNDTVTAIEEKLEEYFTAGFPLVWVVSPTSRRVFVYPNPGKPVVLSEDDDIRCENALPGFVCKVADLFPART